MPRLTPPRREVLTGAVRLGAGWGACRLLGTPLGTGEAFAAGISADEAGLKTAAVRQTVSPGRTLACYMAVPGKARGRHAAVLVAHGDRGLDEPARALARQVARLGYVACAPDFLSRAGGTPDGGDAAALVRGLDVDQAVADALGTVQWLGRNPRGERVLSGRVGALGGSWGGALVERLGAVSGAALAGGVVLSAAAPGASGGAGPVPLLHVASDAPGWSRIAAFFKEHLT